MNRSTIFGLGIVWAGYTLFVYGYSLFQVGKSGNVSPSLSITQLVSPATADVTAYTNAMAIYKTGSPGTTSYIASSAGNNNSAAALALANADVAAACNGQGTPSIPGMTCAQAKTRLANVQSVVSKATS